MASIVKNVVHWGSHSKSQSPVQADLCEICGIKPKFIEKGVKHAYCSRSCARSGQGPSPTVCLLRGCRSTGKPAFSNFCSEVHAQDGVRLGQVEGCEHCNIQPRTVGTLCIACERRARAGTRLRPLNLTGTTFKNVRAQFISEWEDKSARQPTVEKIYEVTVPRDAQTRYEAYRAAHPRAEEIRTFHSSQCICDLGHKDAAPCNFKSCGICNILKTSFKTFAFGNWIRIVNRTRFGDGIYSYRNPSLADQFATSCTSSPYRVMIACDVIVDPGQTGGVDELSDEESIFVQTADAIKPVYVIMYTR
ncbi:hypothetical protein BD779DRAFT_1608447 [Infundibulicybe gibba]|nr:hypothetical protein BD779DRAFT_1608447 [Infundibulicybe gibba]